MLWATQAGSWPTRRHQHFGARRLRTEFEARTARRGPGSVMASLPSTIGAGPIELRRWQPGDLSALVDAVSASLAELRVWMPWARDPVTTDSYEEVLKNFDAAFDAGTEFVFGIFETSGSAVVGGCGLHCGQGPGIGEIGYWVRTDRYRRGFATAAVRALTTATFHYLRDIEEIHVTMDKANAPSAGVPAGLGYKLMMEEDRGIQAPGDTGRGLRWMITRADWRPRAAEVT